MILQVIEVNGPDLNANPRSIHDEEILLSSFLAGNRESAERLVESTYRFIYASLCRLCCGDEHLAADLTQETYRKAWNSLDGFNRKARFSTWLYRIAYHTFLNHVRRPKRVVSVESTESFELNGPGRVSDSDGVDHDMKLRIRQAVMDLPDTLRFTLTARFWAELPVKEIARLEGISSVAVRKRINRALNRIRDGFEEIHL